MIEEISLFSLIMLLFTGIMMKLANKFSDKDENKWSFCYIFLGIIISTIIYWIIKFWE